MGKIIVDAVGEQCPVPVVKADKALRQLQLQDILEVHVDNETAVQNLSRLASGKGMAYSIERVSESLFAVRMAADGTNPDFTIGNETKVAKAGGEAAEDAGAVAACEAMETEDGTAAGQVVVIGSDCMGQGEEELGKILMKGFIYALSQQERLPETVIFYNSGARIPVRGSVALEDLASMEEQGVEILTCGTCLDYYKLKDNLAVGSVTNMYTIVEKLSHAAKVIQP